MTPRRSTNVNSFTGTTSSESCTDPQAYQREQKLPGPHRAPAASQFWHAVAVDLINTPLKRMIEYLNAMSGAATSMIAVEYSRLSLRPSN
ncbi:hypothetical protein QFZ40_002198 [Arthrobacter pascens]|uniref:hypothetical protein n=1 Tax=Arthrobacter pascens TaxID=1677 RepID=UPI00278B7CE4|nr:hypothetical protein [Arthrobacter pascens]MDQ0634289.1 hypothetical protein [Arthrobacter pascens]